MHAHKFGQERLRKPQSLALAVRTLVITQLKSYFNASAFFSISMLEKSSQPTKHEINIIDYEGPES